MKTQEVLIEKVPAVKGGSQISWNVSLNGYPFGQIWTFKGEVGFKYLFNAKALNGEWGQFDNYPAAERFMRGLM